MQKQSPKLIILRIKKKPFNYFLLFTFYFRFASRKIELRTSANVFVAIKSFWHTSFAWLIPATIVLKIKTLNMKLMS